MATTNSHEIHSLRESLALSERQRHILLGCLLGDGCLVPTADQKNYRLQIEQMRTHRWYVRWLYTEFKKWVISPPKYRNDARSWKFRTISHPELTAFARLFYSKRKKVLPADIGNMLNAPLALAVWAMDDGCLMPNSRGFILNTQSFTRKENEELQQCLARNFGITDTTLHKDKNKLRLYIKKNSISMLRDIIKVPYVA